MENEKFRASLQHIKQLVEECLLELGEKHSTGLKQSKVVRQSKASGDLKLDFSMSSRAFIKRYVSPLMWGGGSRVGRGACCQ